MSKNVDNANITRKTARDLLSNPIISLPLLMHLRAIACMSIFESKSSVFIAWQAAEGGRKHVTTKSCNSRGIFVDFSATFREKKELREKKPQEEEKGEITQTDWYVVIGQQICQHTLAQTTAVHSLRH